jgi:hypothetical protein
MKKRLVWLTVLLFGCAVLFASCAAMQKPTESNFKAPVITLESFMVPQYDGYWYYSNKAKPAQGDPGDRGAPLPMTFLFNVKNDNPYPILLENFKFTVGFEGFDLVTVNNDDAYWIPAGKTDQVRATTMITVRSALLSLLVTGGFKLKEMGKSPWDILKMVWTGAPELSVPVTLSGGSFVFSADGVTKVVPLQAKFP